MVFRAYCWLFQRRQENKGNILQQSIRHIIRWWNRLLFWWSNLSNCAEIEKFTKEGSAWMIDKCNTLFLNIAKYEPLKGSSYIPLPEVLANKKAIINVKNQDQECLRWALRSALFPAKNNLNSPYSYPKQDNLNMEGIDFPTPISQINKIERQNNIALNV